MAGSGHGDHQCWWNGVGKLVDLVQQAAMAAAPPAPGWVVEPQHGYIWAEMRPVQPPPGPCWL